jgi:hypothetical protein
MEFKYAMKGEDGNELFEDGVVLARQYLGVGDWQVWDLRPNSARHCPKCSSQAERIVRHERGVRCPGTARSEGRVAAAREAIAKRAARLRELENDRAIARTLRRARELDRLRTRVRAMVRPRARTRNWWSWLKQRWIPRWRRRSMKKRQRFPWY